ncbi:MAG: hypothetical protein WBA48_09030 [Xanthobacteraceae bacterium]
MAIPRGTCPRDWGHGPGDTRFTLVVVACFGAEENQIANITRIFPVPLKTSFQRRAIAQSSICISAVDAGCKCRNGVPGRQKIVIDDVAVNPAATDLTT